MSETDFWILSLGMFFLENIREVMVKQYILINFIGPNHLPTLTYTYCLVDGLENFHKILDNRLIGNRGDPSPPFSDLQLPYLG